MFCIRMNHIVVDNFAVDGGNEIAIGRDGAHRNDVKIKIITAEFVNGQQSERVTQIVDVIRPFTPICALVPMLHQCSGHVFIHLDVDKLDVGVVLHEYLHGIEIGVDFHIRKKYVDC